MLMVTTTMRMVDGIHSNTTSPWPVVSLRLSLVHSSGSLQQRLVGTTATGNDTDHTTGGGWENLLGTGWELDTGLALVGVVADDGDVVSGSTAEGTTVAGAFFNVGDDGTFWAGGEWEDVSDVEGSLLAGVDELTGVHALVGDESFLVGPESVWISEFNGGQRSTTTGVVDYILDDTSDVSVTLGIIDGSELSWSFSQSSMSGEDATATFSLRSDNATHCAGCIW